ncbi:MAG TPA: MFS transporter [Thermomicrobiaceae bacterium]|nr:MFS transporter [Thermomicrobiaceae bacterium]
MRDGRGASSRWSVLALALAVQTAISMVGASLAVLLPFVRSEFHLTFAEAGLVVNFSFVGGFATIAMAGLAVDTLGDRFVLVVGGILTGVAGWLVAIAPNLWVLLAVLFVMGVGVATVTPAGSVAVRRAFPLRLRGMVMSIRQTGIPFGYFFAALALPTIALGHGWRAAVAVAGIVSVIVALGVRLLYRVGPRAVRAESESRGFRGVFNRDSAIASGAGVLLVAAQMSLLTYLVSYLQRDQGLSITTAAAVLAVAQLSGAGGRILWGVVSDRLLGGSRRTALLFSAGTGAAGGIVLALLPHGSPLALLVAAILVAAAGAVGWNGVQISFLSELARPGTEGRNVGIGLMIQQPGILGGPFLFGLVADVTGSFRLSWILLAGFLGTAMLILSAVQEPVTTAEDEPG